jgi:Flp pilus assembly protein CpaB
MEIEYRDDRRRGKLLIFGGLILAVAAGAGAFFLLTQAQKQASEMTLPQAQVVVATKTIPARTAITAADVVARQVPLDPANAAGVVVNVDDVIGRIPAVTILQDQIVTSNMLASTTEGGEFSILQPDETVGPDSPAWRAVSITVPDDLAVGGMLTPGQSVDVFVTIPVNVSAEATASGRYVSDRSTKLTYQNILILAREDAFYVVRVSLPVAEEIGHLQASGSTFGLALRPDVDQRLADTGDLGETTNRIIEKYGLPIPEPVAPGGVRPMTTSPTSGLTSPVASPEASGGVAPAASPAP